MSKEHYLHHPVKPFEVAPGATASQLLEAMKHTAFQGRNLGTAMDIWTDMLQDEVTIFFGLAGAMVPAGMRRILMHLIEHRMIDCLVSTGANLFHDMHESLGRFHYQGSATVDDNELGRERINRIYDVFASEDEFIEGDEFITDFTKEIDRSEAYTTREFFQKMGEKLIDLGKGEGILTTAARAGVPVYCPAVGDSVHGMAVAAARVQGKSNIAFDIVGDVLETTNLAIQAQGTGVIYVGGGTPKNFIQQAEVSAYMMGKQLEGHRYAIQMTVDAPHWGGLSGCTFEEAQSWRKIAAKARKVTIHCDATIALPLLVSAVTEQVQARLPHRVLPEMSQAFV